MITLAKLASIAPASDARTRACLDFKYSIHLLCASATETCTTDQSSVYATYGC